MSARHRALVPAALLLAAACGDAGTGPEPTSPAGIDALFAPPTAAELDAVRAEWASRDPGAAEVREEASSSLPLGLGTARVLSHVTDGGRHYGVVVVPAGADPGELPVLLYLHGGDGGVSRDELLTAILLLGAGDDFVYAAPSFRSERLGFGDAAYRSEGEASPWDRDVDDAMAFLDAVLEATPAADPERVAALGVSRGGGVAMLMGIRDPRVDGVVELFGPTDFLHDWVRGLFEDALAGTLPDLPGVDALDRLVLAPWREDAISLAGARSELIRRSPVYFAADLPPLQAHHGTEDEVVPVSQAERLGEAMEDIGRGPPDFQLYLYEGAGHDVQALPSAAPSAREFLRGLWTAPLAAAP